MAMKTLSALLFLFSLAPTAEAAPIMERRIWVEQKGKDVEKEQCEDSQKQWRCIFPVKKDCEGAMRELGKYCGNHVIPDLPEYVDSEETTAKAKQVLIQCLALEFSKKHLIGLPKDKMTAYNECTGVTPRSKPLNPNLQRAMDFSKSQLSFTCAADGYMRKCFGYDEKDCNNMLSKTHLACTMRWETEGKKVAPEEAAVQEAGKKITDCTLAEARATAAKERKKSAHKDCQ
jgi:hypothetical protein